MAELMLINPRGKRRSSKKRRAKRPGARRRKNPVPATALMTNPRKRRAKKRASPTVKRFKRRAKGTALTAKGFLNNTLMPSAVGAGGALGLDVLLGFLPLPAMIKSGPMRPFVRLAGAVALGMIASKVMNKKVGEQVASGAATVVLYDTLKGVLQRAMPTLPLSDGDAYYPGLEYVSPGYQVDMGEYVGEEIVQPMGEYVEY